MIRYNAFFFAPLEIWVPHPTTTPEGIYGSLIGIGIQDIVSNTFSALLALFSPATIIVALKTVFNISKI